MRIGRHERLVRDTIDPREDLTEGELRLLKTKINEARTKDLEEDAEKLHSALTAALDYIRNGTVFRAENVLVDALAAYDEGDS